MNKEFLLHVVILVLVFGSGIAFAIESNDSRILLVLGITVVLGIVSWVLGDIVSSRIARVFFRITKFSWLHLRTKPEVINDTDYFLSKAETNPVSSLFLLWIGSWALLVFLSYNLVFSLGISLSFEDPVVSQNFDVLIFAWALTPLVAFLVVPVSIIESSHLRLFLQSKKIVISPTTPLRYIIGGFATINILITLLRGLDMPEMITGLLYLPAPFYIMTLLYRFRSEKKLIGNFKSYLKDKGIVEKEPFDFLKHLK